MVQVAHAEVHGKSLPSFFDLSRTAVLPTRAPAVDFTIITSPHPIVKSFTLGDDGRPKKIGEAGVSSGTAARIELRGTPTEMAEQFAAHLQSMTERQVLILAPPPAGRGEWALTTKEKIEARPDAIARTKRFFQPVSGSHALLGLDLDVKDYPPQVRAQLKAFAPENALTAVLASVFPGFLDAAAVWRLSSSSGIRVRGKKVSTGAAGQHRYYFGADGGDIEDFVQRLHDRLMLSGWIWGKVTANGSVLPRTLIDLIASRDVSRLWFESNSSLKHDELEHDKSLRDPTVKTGGFLDTRALPPLTPAEREKLA